MLAAARSKRSLFAPLLVCLCLTGCSNSKPSASTGGGDSTGKRFVILMNGDSPFWDAVRAGMNDAAKELKVTAVLENNDGTPAGQIEKLRQFGTQSDIAAVAISATDAANATLVDELRKLKDKGIPVITVDSDIDREKFRDARVAFVGTDNFSAGKALGVAAKTIVPKGAYVQFVGRTGAQNAIERMGGVKEGTGDKLVERDRMGDENDLSRARQNVVNAIINHPDVNLLVGIWSYNAPAIAEVVGKQNKKDKITVVAFDAEQQAIKYVESGDIKALVVQNPYQMGFQGVKLLKALAGDDKATVAELLPNLGQPDGDLYDTGLKIVVPNEGSPLSANLFDAKTEFLKLDDFRNWLNKYGLNSS